MADPLGKVSRSGSYRHGGAAWRWRRRGSLTVLSGEEGGWWPAAAPVSFYNTDEGRWSLDTSQMNKNDTWGGAHQEGGATVLRRDSGVEKGPPWPVTASEVMGGQKSGGGGGGYSGGAFCADRRRLQWSSWRLQCRHKGKRSGSSAGDATWRQGENGARHPGSCAGAVETGAGRVMCGAMWEQWSGQHMWAAREHVGQSEDVRSWVGPERTMTFEIYSNQFQTSSIFLTKRWTYQAPKIPNKIWLERA
jgi:hypothetical protein